MQAIRRMRDAVQGSSVHIQKKAGGTVTFGRKLAPEGSLSHRLAKAARGFPIVCVLALDTSAALAQPSVTQAPASDASTMAYSPQRHDALIAARREGRVTPAQVAATGWGSLQGQMIRLHMDAVQWSRLHACSV